MFNSEMGHDVLCLWPYRPCHMVCDHLLVWQSHKFSSPLAERLWTLSLEGAQDAECGEAETVGWYARFAHEGVILSADAQGFVDVTIPLTGPQMEELWEALEASAAAAAEAW